MANEKSVTIKICDWVIKYSIYAVIFLMPIFFLPWTSDVLDFNKQAVLIFFSFIALFFWMLKTLVSAKFEINLSKMHIFAGVFFLIYLMATLFSSNRYGSFWGWPQITAESLFSLMGLLVFYFLVSNVFSKKEIVTSLVVFSVSAIIAELIGVFQLFGLFVPFSFAKTVSFNTIGSVGAFGFFAALLLPLAIVMLIEAKKLWKILFVFELILSALILFMVDYPIVWWAVIAGSLVIMIFGIMKRNVFDGRWMALPMFFLAISIFFILINPQIPGISQKANEIFLSQQASGSISLQAIKNLPVLGSGPGTFAYDFSKFKDPNFSQSSLWNTIFSQATSKFLNDLASTGILGIIALLAMLFVPIFYGFKFLFSDKNSSGENDNKNEFWTLVLGLSALLFAEAISFFLYNSNIVLNFLDFFMLAALVGIITHKKTEFELKQASMTTLIVTFVFTLVFIFGLGLLILDGQRYVAEINYNIGLSQWQTGNGDAGTKSLETAASLNSSSDLYFRQLSQAYLLTLQNEMKNVTASSSDAEKGKIQTLIANSVNAAKYATNLNPQSSANWSNLGYVYQSLNGLITDSATWALSSYDSALKLDPNDPYLFAQEGIINYITKTPQTLATAQSELQKAVGLNPNYSDALYSLGLVYDALGDKTDAIAEFTKVQQLNPKDTTIPKILANLNAGLPALQQATPPAVTPPASDSTLKTTVPDKKKSVTPLTVPAQ